MSILLVPKPKTPCVYLTDLLMWDRESKREIDSITTICLDQLKFVREKHGENISTIRNQAEKCFTKDYMVVFDFLNPQAPSVPLSFNENLTELYTHSYMNEQVDQHTSTTPKKRAITVPSLASIEEMRTPAFENLQIESISDNRSKLGHHESKIPQLLHMAASPNRTPFSDVN